MTSLSLTPLRSGLAGGLIEFRQAFSGAALAGQLLWPGATLAALFFLRHREFKGSSFTLARCGCRARWACSSPSG
jgi:ABC-2 type transport system permease protein